METIFLRLGLSIGFLSAVADRLGLWGTHGKATVSWGDMAHFMPYVAKLNPWVPISLIPVVGWTATIAEASLGLLLLVGWQTRWAARLSGCLLLAFVIGMTVGIGVKPVFDYSVLTASAGAFMLAAASKYALSIDAAMLGRAKALR